MKTIIICYHKALVKIFYFKTKLICNLVAFLKNNKFMYKFKENSIKIALVFFRHDGVIDLREYKKRKTYVK